MKGYFKEFGAKVKESAISVLPFFLVIMCLYLIFLPFNFWSFFALIIATIVMILGMSLFNVGVDMSTLKMGSYVGAHLSNSRRFSFLIILSFIMGFIVTIAEPDLMVLAEQVPGISSKWIILITVSAGTGIFLLLSTIKTLFGLSIRTILMISYALALVLSFFAPSNFVPLSFDAIGVTTGAVSVPFIMSFGLGICAVRSSKNSEEDGFGLIALASIGPVISMLIVSLFLSGQGGITTDVVGMVATGSDLGMSLLSNMLDYLKEVFVVIIPIFLFFLIYNFMYLKLPKVNLLRIFVGLIYTYIGLVIFLTGVTSGYLPTADILGYTIANSDYKWTLIPIALIIGFFLVFAEPAVHVLNAQIEEITNGVIKKRTMLIGISIGVAIAMLLIVFRALFDIDFMYINVPLVLLLVILSIFTPNLFEGIAFDSGGAAAGSLTASFVLPFVIGVTRALGLDAMSYAFGSIGIVAMLPSLVIQIIGIRYNYIINKSKKKTKHIRSVEIIDFD